MKKIINSPNDLTRELLEGFCYAYSDEVKLIEGTHTVVRRKPKEAGKVKLVIGNGSGHEPCTNGWVGKGMLDMDIVGDIFSAPSYDVMFDSLKLIDDGSPILLFVQNHAGDVLNANICYEMAIEADMNIKKVLFYDDVASAPLEFQEERRGMAGYIFYMKIVGAMAEAGCSLEECVAMFEKVRGATRTISTAIDGGTNPQTGIKLFNLNENEIEIGMGVHGEGGVTTVPLCTAKELAEKICDILIADGGYQNGDEIITLVNGSGATTVMELNIIYKGIFEYLSSKGIKPESAIIDNLLTTQESAGFSISMLKVAEDMKPHWDAESNAPYFKS